MYMTDYEGFELYVEDFAIGGNAFVYDKEDEEWYQGKVTGIATTDATGADETYDEQSQALMMEGTAGEFVTDDAIYYVQVTADRFNVGKPIFDNVYVA